MGARRDRSGAAGAAGALLLVLTCTLNLTPAALAASAERAQASGTAITPFEIAVLSSVLTDLKERLTRARFPEEIPGMDWNDGVDLT